MTWSGFDSGFAQLSSGTRMNSNGVTGKPGSWESLRKQARSLENEIDVKLVLYSKLGTNYSRSSQGPADQQPLLGDGDSKIDTIGTEIETLIEQLNSVNESMAEFATNSGQSAAIHHTLQRHTEILQDYRQEFRKTAANIAAIVEREDLLSSVHNDINDFKQDGKTNKRMDALLRESEHTRNSERLIDEQINIAMETRDSLVNQRVAFKAIQTKLNDLTNKFPIINNLVNKINFRKRRDSIILGCIIGFCLVALLWYAFG